MDPLHNPFSPGAGSPPPELTGRSDLIEIARILLGRIKAGRHEQSLMLVGLRGVGKTVLLNKFREMAEAEEFLNVFIEVTEDKPLSHILYPGLRTVLLQLDRIAAVSAKVKLGLRILRSFIGSVKLDIGGVPVGLEVDPEIGKADSGNLESDLTDLFVAVGDAAKDRGKAVAIFIDEIQYLTELEMGSLIMAIHRISQLQLPLVLIGAGLPQLVALAGKSKSYAERLFQYPGIGPLEKDDAGIALQEPVKEQGIVFDDDAIEEIFKQTKGYPYFLQEWGYASWNLAEKSPINKADVQKSSAFAIKKLDASFFRVRFDRLTPREKAYLRAMAELGPGPHRSGDISDKLKVKVESVAPIRSGLIKKGMVYSPAHGDTAFTVPLFDEFMKRAIPDNE